MNFSDILESFAKGLARKRAAELIPSITANIVQNFDPEKIILVGSYARGLLSRKRVNKGR